MEETDVLKINDYNDDDERMKIIWTLVLHVGTHIDEEKDDQSDRIGTCHGIRACDRLAVETGKPSSHDPTIAAAIVLQASVVREVRIWCRAQMWE